MQEDFTNLSVAEIRAAISAERAQTDAEFWAAENGWVPVSQIPRGHYYHDPETGREAKVKAKHDGSVLVTAARPDRVFQAKDPKTGTTKTVRIRQSGETYRISPNTAVKPGMLNGRSRSRAV